MIGWCALALLCLASSALMLVQGRDFYGNDGCADDRKWPLA